MDKAIPKGPHKGAGRPKGSKKNNTYSLRVMIRMRPDEHAAMQSVAKSMLITTPAAYRRAVKDFIDKSQNKA